MDLWAFNYFITSWAEKIYPSSCYFFQEKEHFQGLRHIFYQPPLGSDIFPHWIIQHPMATFLKLDFCEKFNIIGLRKNKSFTSLEFGDNIGKLMGLDEALGGNKSIKYLKMGGKFNESLDFIFKNNNTITHLTLGKHFNQNIDSIAKNAAITHLTLGDGFNQDINTILTYNKTITHLTLGGHYNQSSIDEIANNCTITHLTLGNNFKHNVDPIAYNNTITHLTFGDNFNHDINTIIANNKTITHLNLGGNYSRPIGEIEKNTTITHFTGVFEQIEQIANNNSITHLKLGGRHMPKIDSLARNKNLTHLTIVLERLREEEEEDNKQWLLRLEKLTSLKCFHINFSDRFLQDIMKGRRRWRKEEELKPGWRKFIIEDGRERKEEKIWKNFQTNIQDFKICCYNDNSKRYFLGEKLYPGEIFERVYS